jgi:fumarylacetoacetate (FAA) hydrolase
MKLGSLKSKKSLDGELIVVSRDHQRFVKVAEVAPDLQVSSLREALEHWERVAPRCQEIFHSLENMNRPGEPLDVSRLHSCLPRTFLFADGSAFIHHIKLVRKARGAELPETLTTVPLMYQGDSGGFLASTEDIPQIDFSHGTDFEAEVAVITDFVPMGTDAENALKHIKLVCLINDVSLRGLIPGELAQGFGFFQSKPASALSPLAISSEELGAAWKEGRIHLPLNINLNGEIFGRPNAQEMHFHFGQLIAHAAKTRNLAAGTLIGSGTVSNQDSNVGSGCLAEKRTLEQIETGKAITPFMKVGDKVEIWMENPQGQDLFGRIAQKVSKA